MKSRTVLNQFRMLWVSTRGQVSRRFRSVLVPIFQNWSLGMRQSGHAHLPRNLKQARRHLAGVESIEWYSFRSRSLTSPDSPRHI